MPPSAPSSSIGADPLRVGGGSSVGGADRIGDGPQGCPYAPPASWTMAAEEDSSARNRARPSKPS